MVFAGICRILPPRNTARCTARTTTTVMALQYGLNVKKKKGPPPNRVRDAFFDDDDDDEEVPSNEQAVDEISSFSNAPSRSNPPPPKPKSKGPPNRLSDDGPVQNLSSLEAARRQVEAAEEVDAAIFDYDSFHDAKTTVTEAKKAAARQDAVERKPKYIANLLDAASRRKQDQLIAREKLLQKEREAEGDDFADKEKFVTGAYKLQQAEAQRLEEEEKKRAEEDERRKRQLGGGMQGFYRSMMDQTERQHLETMEAAAKVEKEGGVKGTGEAKRKTDVELAAEMQAKGVHIHINDEGQVTDKRELLAAGLNVAPAGKAGGPRGSDHLLTANRPAQQSAFLGRNAAGQQATRERQTRMMEEQLAAQHKRAREEEEEELARVEKAAKSSKSEKDVSDAKARYLARKAAKERGEG